MTQSNTMYLKQAVSLGLHAVSAIESHASMMKSPYQRCLTGLVTLAQKHAEAALAAFEAGNAPAAMALARILLGTVLNLDYIVEQPAYRDYRASLLLMEDIDHRIRIVSLPNATGVLPQDPRRPDLIRVLEGNRADLVAKSADLPRGPADPARWIPRTSPHAPTLCAKPRARGWESFFVLIFEAGSAFASSDGYAINEVRESRALLGWEQLPEFIATLLLLIVDAVFDEWPSIEHDGNVRPHLTAFTGR